MDGRRFDAFTRAIAQGMSRRSLIRGVMASAAGGVLLRLQGRSALAQDCTASVGGACQADGECQGAGTAVQCPFLFCCDGVCVDTLTDFTSCGSCGSGCAEGEICQSGQCASACAEGQALCATGCVDLQFDQRNCGECGVGCEGLTCCDGACVDVAADLVNCGLCSVTCGSDELCEGGICALICPSGFIPCSGICVDVSTDPANCGACGRACEGQICEAGACVDLPCQMVQGQDGELTYRYTVDSPDDELVLETERTVQVDAEGADTAIVSSTTITRAGDRILQLVHRYLADESWSVTLRYGAVFGGIGEAVFWGRGEDGPVRARVDDRRLEPFGLGDDLAAVRFADGGPAPESAIDAALAAALGRLFEQAQGEVALCEPEVPGESAAMCQLASGRLRFIAAGYSALLQGDGEGQDYCDPGHVSYPPWTWLRASTAVRRALLAVGRAAAARPSVVAPDAPPRWSATGSASVSA